MCRNACSCCSHYLDSFKKRGHLRLTALEGAAFALRHNLDATRTAGVQIVEATGIGCTMAAAVDCRAFSGLEEACARLSAGADLWPNSANRAVYDALYEKFLLLY